MFFNEKIFSSSKTKVPSQKNMGINLLTPREKEVCRLTAYGYTSLEISEIISISPRTVHTHRANVMSKLEFKNRAELVHFAIDNGLMRTE